MNDLFFIMVNPNIRRAFLKVKFDIKDLYDLILVMNNRMDRFESQLVSIESQLVSVLSQKSLNKNESTREKESQSCLSFVSEKSQDSLNESQRVSIESQKSLNNKSYKIEDKVMRRLRRTKKRYIIIEINKLIDMGKEIPDIKYELVDEKGLCSKASFYRYIQSLNLKIETKLRLN